MPSVESLKVALDVVEGSELLCVYMEEASSVPQEISEIKRRSLYINGSNSETT